MRFDQRGVGSIEFAVDEAAEEQLLIFAGGHHLTLLD
jgi:hypothetical protein